MDPENDAQRPNTRFIDQPLYFLEGQPTGFGVSTDEMRKPLENYLDFLSMLGTKSMRTARFCGHVSIVYGSYIV